MWRVASALLSRQVFCLNLMDCIIEPFDHWAYTFYFWALAQSTYLFKYAKHALKLISHLTYKFQLQLHFIYLLLISTIISMANKMIAK
jgi:hypothetical protein